MAGVLDPFARVGPLFTGVIVLDPDAPQRFNSRQILQPGQIRAGSDLF
jgi:hypothetical protein